MARVKKNEVRMGVTEIESKILIWIFTNLRNGALGGKSTVITRRPEFATLSQKIEAVKLAHAEAKTQTTE